MRASPRPLMMAALLAVAAPAGADEPPSPWLLDRQLRGAELVYEHRKAPGRTADDPLTVDLARFTSRAQRLIVIDLGPDPAARPAFAGALRAAGAVAGVNGGFFHPDLQPLGLVVAQGRRIHRFETAKLLSGVLYSDAQGIHLLRRQQFQDHAGIAALLQSGPYLVEAGRAVRGLSTVDSSLRTFVATDGRGHWLLGATRQPLTLADLGDWLAVPAALAPWRIDRALNLDGGYSTGFFFARGAGRTPVERPPRSRVRTLVGVAPRDAG